MPSNVMVFSHPNHEIAALGTIDRIRPHVVYLTDGGGEDRVSQTRDGLSSYLQPEMLHFLNHSEISLYGALLSHAADFCLSIAMELRDILRRLRPRVIYCDAVEFYNPVHDLTLPIVRAALGKCDDTPVFEVPLIHQKVSDGAFEMQRVPPSLESDCIWFDLNDAELQRKREVLTGDRYKALFSQMGSLILSAIPSRAQREQFLRARSSLPRPAPEQMLRYEERGHMLKSNGVVRDVIGYHEHYVPMFTSLCSFEDLSSAERVEN